MSLNQCEWLVPNQHTFTEYY